MHIKETVAAIIVSPRVHLALILSLSCSKRLHGFSPPPPILSEIFFDRALRVVLIFYKDDFKAEVFPSLEMNYNKMIVYIKFQLIVRDFHKNYYTFRNQSRVCETFENVSSNLSIV